MAADSQMKKVSEFKRGTKGAGWNEVHMQPEEKEYSYTNSLSSADGEWYYAAPTPGSANGTKMGAIDQTMMFVVINEIDFKNSKIELYNCSSEEIDLMGFPTALEQNQQGGRSRQQDDMDGRNKREDSRKRLPGR